MKKLILSTLLILFLLPTNAYSVRLSGGTIAANTGNENSAFFIRDVPNITRSVHDFQRLQVCGDYMYLDFMQEVNLEDSDWDDSKIRYDLANNKISQYRLEFGGTQQKDDHNYFYTVCDPNATDGGKLFTAGGVHYRALRVYKKNDDSIGSSWTSLGNPSNMSDSTYPRICIDSSGYKHIFARQRNDHLDATDTIGRYITHARYTGSGYDQLNSIVDWVMDADPDISTGSKMYFEMACEGDDAHIFYNVRDGDSQTVAPDTFHHVGYVKYEMDTENMYNAAGDAITSAVTYGTADFVQTGNRFYVKGVGYSSLKSSPVVLYIKDQDGQTAWFNGDQQMYVSWYESGWQTVEPYNISTINEPMSLLDPINTDKMYILFEDRATGRTSYITSSTTLTTWDTVQKNIPCNYVLEQNPDLTKPVYCMDGEYGQGSVNLYTIDLPE